MTIISGTNAEVTLPMEDSAEQDSTDEDEHDDAGDRRVDVEGLLQVRGDRVGLGHVADTEGRDDRGDGEEPGEELAEGTLDAALEVALRAAGHVALGVRDAVPDTEERLGVLGRHAEQTGDPHPEQGAGATDRDRRGDTDDIAHAHGGCQGGGQSLVLGDVTFAAVVVAVEEAESEGREELSELHPPQPDGEDEAGAEQQGDEEPGAPDKGVGVAEPVIECVHEQTAYRAFAR
jgi:hypothetical protein